MSMILMARVMKTRVGNSLRKLILLKLADNADDFGLCRPSYQHIADQCEMGRSTVIRHVKALEDAGWLLRRKRGRDGLQTSNEFSLNLDFLAGLGGGVTAGPPSVTAGLPSGVRAGPPSVRAGLPSGVRAGPGTSHSSEPEEKVKKKKFLPPTFEQVAGYIAQQDLQVCPERFFDHYTANGWKVGKVSMKDWQATARNWSRKNAEGNQHRESGRRSAAQRHHDALKRIAAEDAEGMGGGFVQ